MRPIVTSALLALTLVASPALAEDPQPKDVAEPVAEVVKAEAPEAPEMILEQVQVEERAAAEDSAKAQTPAKGSFWWLVGVVVVAGVILAIIL